MGNDRGKTGAGLLAWLREGHWRASSFGEWSILTASTLCLLSLAAVLFWTAVVARQAYLYRGWPATLEREVRAAARQDQPKVGPASGNKTAGAKNAAGTSAPITGEQKSAIQEALEAARDKLTADIHTHDESERFTLNVLTSMVGTFAALLGLSAFLVVKVSRDEVKQQLEAVKYEAKEELTRIADFDTKLKQELTNLRNSSLENELIMRAQYEKQYLQFLEERKSDVLELRHLKSSLRTLLFELDATLPEESNWNAKESYDQISEGQRQNIRLSEYTIGALQIFVSTESTEARDMMSRMYRALARFYLGQYQALRIPQDAERADNYAQKSMQLQSRDPDAMRLRGSISLARYWILREKATESGGILEGQDELLALAESYLRAAAEQTAKQGRFDAGAACNRALVAICRKDLVLCETISRGALAQRENFSYLEINKYAPAIYANLASCQIFMAKSSENTDEIGKLLSQAVADLEECDAYLKAKKASEGSRYLHRQIEKELRSGGDFFDLPPELQERVRRLILPTSGQLVAKT